MASTLRPTPPPSTSPTPTPSRRSKMFLPLSSHGMPKTPLPNSPGGSLRSHRFSYLYSPPLSPALRSPSLASPTSPRSPMSPMMSPPMSAKSFSTFIESEPSTPAYSPRQPSSDWDGSTLVLLSPVPASTEQSPLEESPVEPEWEMCTPVKKEKKEKRMSKSSGVAPVLEAEMKPRVALGSHPVNVGLESQREKDEKEKENVAPVEDHDEREGKGQDEKPHAHHNNLVTRMKSMLRRKTVSERKTEGKRRYTEEVDRMEDVHWTEM